MAAEKEFAPSQFAVGLYYKNGWGVEQSDEMAFNIINSQQIKAMQEHNVLLVTLIGVAGGCRNL